ncbi:MAG: hypothetical protein DRO67_04535 [Candidatus Asgardarchaeum californiense]|nr:MAG: hypothetical protein DRO67_04535 [Candidatus Asgardarchaeum californiense]
MRQNTKQIWNRLDNARNRRRYIENKNREVYNTILDSAMSLFDLYCHCLTSGKNLKSAKRGKDAAYRTLQAYLSQLEIL